jgi:HEAT repeat protein
VTVQLRQMLFFCGVLAMTWPAAAQDFHPAELDTALGFLHLRAADFASDRVWMEDDTFLLPKIRESLETPQSAYRVAHQFSAAVPGSVAEAGRVNDMAAFIEATCPEVVCRDIDAQLAAAPPTSSDPFEPMLSAFALAEGYRAQAFARLSPAEQQALLLAIPLWFEDEEIAADDTLKGCLQRAFGAAVDTTQRVDADSVLTLLSRVNRNALSAAVYAFARGLSATAESWKTTKSPFSATSVPGAEGLILATRETPFGTFILGGSGPNAYTGDFALIIDLGGDDRYLNRVGAGVAGLGRPVSAVIDLGGNDLYLSDRLANQGCGILGLGALVDLAGNDVYRTRSFAQGAGFCGAGLFFDGGGNDIYQAETFAQGAAVCAIGLMVDGGGRDLYDLGMYGQGFASTFGAAALVDNAGDDVYRAGGTQMHVPLRPEDYRSFAQGFAIGSRPRGGGGFGLLHDRSGNDFYDAEIYAQGVGYWYSLGILMDDAGNDAYNATQYVQGAGIHLAAGVLEDGGGDDRYASRFGPGQGGAHDLSVAFFYDHAGDDQYILSGGQSMAINNSASLFYDAAGNDQYCTIEPGLGQGGAREARGFGSLAVFLDGEGHDAYPGRVAADSALWFEGLFGVGYDVARDSLRPREAPVSEVTLTAADSQRTIEDLFRDASRWEVTDNREIVARARKALAAKGMDAVRWVGTRKLNTNDGLERRAIVDLFKLYPDSSAPFLFAALDSNGQWYRRNAVAVFGELKYRPAVPVLLRKLRDPTYERLRPSILYTLGDIGDSTATGLLMEFSRSGTERERINATVSLGKLADWRGFETILARTADPEYTVKSAAMLALAAQGPDVLPNLDRALANSDSAELETLLLAAARLGQRWQSDAVLKKSTGRLAAVVRRYVDYPDPRVQGAAFVAVAELLPARDVEKLRTKLADVNDPVLQARLRQVEKKTK